MLFIAVVSRTPTIVSPGSLLQLSPSEQLGDLFKGAGDNATALACYQSTGATVKVVEGAVDLCLMHCQLHSAASFQSVI